MSNTYKKVIWDWVLLPVLGGSAIAIFFCPDCLSEGDYIRLFQNAVISMIFWMVLGGGNVALVNVLDKRWSWITQPVKRSAMGILAMLIYTVIASSIIVYVYIEFYLGHDFEKAIDGKTWLSSITPALLITIFISLVMHGRGFLLAWRNAAIDVERLKNKNLKSQYESLKNQINPHFLFNSLNALSSLVYSNQEHAVEFIRKLADVYRYVLDHQFEEVVRLKTEMEFVESFVYLNKIRFGENLTIAIRNAEVITEQDSVPPIAVQMLVENALKHNVVSKDQKLSINIDIQKEYISVSNNINVKTQKEDSSGIGLSNISSRYGFLTDQKVEVRQDDEVFEVKLPILKMQN